MFKSMSDSESQSFATIGMRSLKNFKAFDEEDKRIKRKRPKKIETHTEEEHDPIEAACARAAEIEAKKISAHKVDRHAQENAFDKITLEELEQSVLYDCITPAGAQAKAHGASFFEE